jgi:hypothetical protein
MLKGGFLFAVLIGLFGAGLRGQEVVLREVPAVSMPALVDSNSPAFWRDGRLVLFGSHGMPWRGEAPDQFGPWEMANVDFQSDEVVTRWIESVATEDNGLLWAWYHTEPENVVPGTTLTAPKIGALMSVDGGVTMQDLGTVLESGDPINPQAQNGYFVGGHGDFTVILDRTRTYFYFLFGNYGGATDNQGVCIARMAYADRFSPQGKVWKYFNGTWTEPGRGGRMTPIFPARRGWQRSDPDSMWGPSIHWNTHLKCYVMLLNHTAGLPAWTQEGIYISFGTDLSRPETWTQPHKILAQEECGSWYPQVMGLGAGDTDRHAGETARLYVGGTSRWEITFVAPRAAPTDVQLSMVPAGGLATEGEPVGWTVAASGTGPFTYQWFKDGRLLPEATGAAHTIEAAGADDTGTYTVVVTNELGSATSNALTLVVGTTDADGGTGAPVRTAAYLANLSVRARLAGGSALTVGYVVHTAVPKPLALRAIGPSLALFGIADGLPDPRLDIYDATGTKIAENDDWAATDASAFAALGAFALPPGSADAAVRIDVTEGGGTARVTGAGEGMTLVEIYDAAASTGSKLVNLSARTRVGQGDEVMIGGFRVTGTGTKRLLIRALGPQLAAFGVSETLDDPLLKVYSGGATPIAQNDNWAEALAASFATAGASLLPSGSRDAAVVIKAAAGRSYTVVVQSASGSVGEALLEIYELP